MEFNSYRSSYSVIKRGVEMNGRAAYGPAEQLAEFIHVRPNNSTRKTWVEFERMKAWAIAELRWWNSERPYYNVYPSILEMLLDVSLEVPLSAVVFPHDALLIRLPAGVATTRLKTVFVSAVEDPSNKELMWFTAVTQRAVSKDEVCIDTFVANKNQSIESLHLSRDLLEGMDLRYQMAGDQEVRKALQVSVGVSILANDPNFVQPIVLNRDKLKYANADDATKAYLEARAARLQGRGFTVGEQLEKDLAAEKHDVSAHIRRPHMAMFWTGKGREIPRLQLRRGCLVKPHDITTVPTGFMDREPACNEQ